MHAGPILDIVYTSREKFVIHAKKVTIKKPGLARFQGFQ